MPSPSDRPDDLVAALAAHYGQPDPPPAVDDPFARTLAAALGRTVETRRVGRLLDGWRDAGVLEPAALADAGPAELAEIGRQRGVPLAARTLGPVLRLARWWADRGGADAIAAAPTEALRDELVGLNGVGPALADTILLHGLGRPVYPVDRASYRILVRHGWLDPDAGIEEARGVVEPIAGGDAGRLARLAGWLDRVGAEYCRPSAPRCERCPLRPFLPEGGPRSPGE